MRRRGTCRARRGGRRQLVLGLVRRAAAAAGRRGRTALLGSSRAKAGPLSNQDQLGLTSRTSGTRGSLYVQALLIYMLCYVRLWDIYIKRGSDASHFIEYERNVRADVRASALSVYYLFVCCHYHTYALSTISFIYGLLTYAVYGY